MVAKKKPAHKFSLPELKHGVPLASVRRVKRALDRMTSAELGAFWSKYRRGTPTASQELLGGWYPNVGKVASRLATYAINLGTAKSAARDGDAIVAKKYRSDARAFARSLKV